MKKRPTHILAIRLSALGDVAMTIPILYSVARTYPDLRITVLTRPFFARLFLNKPENLSVATYDANRSLWQNLRRVATLRPDGVADLHNVLRSWIIGAYFRIKGIRVVMLDKRRHQRRQLTSGGKGGAQQSYIERYQEVFQALGYPVETVFTSLFEHQAPPPAPLTVPQRSIGIAPFARYYTKTYPLELMKQVVELLSRKGYAVYLFGGRGHEAETLNRWQEEIPNTTSVAGCYPLEDELALMSHLKLMVSMDSANQHLASLVGTPTLTLWGGTTPECGFLGYAQQAENTLCSHLNCQPCSIAGTPDCKLGTLACMTSISPQAVADRVEQMLA